MTNEAEWKELNKQRWDSLAEKLGKKYGRDNLFFLRYFQQKALKLVPLREKAVFLDIACGSGWAVRRAAGLDAGGKYYGIDLSPKMIGAAVNNSEGIKNAQFSVASADSLPFGADYFDAIICTNAFHHFPNPVKALSEAYRVLKPGGKICIVDPAGGMIIRFIDKLRDKTGKAPKQQYTTKEFREFFSRAKLKYIATKTLFYPVKAHIAEK